MAQNSSSNPWYMDAAGQGEGFGPNKDGISVVFDTKPYINQVKLETGDGGDFLMYSRKNAGSGDHARIILLKLDNTPANDTLWIPMDCRVDGVYIQTLATNAAVYVFHGEK